jgi:class 3 adenylate cyclase
MDAAGVASVAGAELAAAQEPGGPRGPVDASWLILQRLDDLRRAQDELRAEVKQEIASMRADVKTLDAKIESVRADVDAKIEFVRRDSLGLWRWSLALLLVPILGLLAKLLIPGA